MLEGSVGLQQNLKRRVATAVRTAVAWCLPSPGDLLNLDPISLKFLDRGMEDGFQRSLTKSLPSNIILLCVMLLLLIVHHALINASEDLSQGLDLTGMVGSQMNRRINIAAGVQGAFCLVVAIAMRCKIIVSRLTPYVLEWTGVVVGLVILIWSSSATLWYVTKMSGYNPKILLADPCTGGGFSDASTVMVLSALPLVLHFGLPVRWVLLWVVEAFSLTLYGLLAYGLGSPEHPLFRARNLNRLFWCVALTTVLKRRLEAQQRHLFACLLQEKTLRCQSEFQCEQLSRHMQRHKPPPDPLTPAAETRETMEPGSLDSPEAVLSSAAPSSMRTTTSTGRLFESVREGALPDALESFVQVGLQEQWLVNPRDVSVAPRQILGLGAMGMVVAGRLFGRPVAVKVSKAPRDDFLRRENLAAMAMELRVLRHIRHPHIVILHGAWVNPTQNWLAIVLERVEGCTLESVVLRRAVYQSKAVVLANDASRTKVIIGICHALRYLHRLRPCIVHGDLKASNVLIEATTQCPKLIDFGLARVVTRNALPMGGTPRWCAPELLGGSPPAPSAATDVFSFGRIIHFIVVEELPLSDLPDNEQIRRAFKARGLPRPAWPRRSDWEATAEAVATPCLEGDPGARPPMEQVQPQLQGWLAHTLFTCVEDQLDLHAFVDLADGLGTLLEDQQSRRCNSSTAARAAEHKEPKPPNREPARTSPAQALAAAGRHFRVKPSYPEERTVVPRDPLMCRPSDKANGCSALEVAAAGAHLRPAILSSSPADFGQQADSAKAGPPPEVRAGLGAAAPSGAGSGDAGGRGGATQHDVHLSL